MVFKKLTSEQLTELWYSIEEKASHLRNAAMSHRTVKVYHVLDELDLLRRRLQHHHAAVALEERKKGENDT